MNSRHRNVRRHPDPKPATGSTLKAIIEHARLMKIGGMNEKRIAEVTAQKCRKALSELS